jgi:hypothetical protein
MEPGTKPINIPLQQAHNEWNSIIILGFLSRHFFCASRKENISFTWHTWMAL